ncbi:GNAT family N-acetyltransferase [Paracoccus liaowanqingii]|uniref:GNAT family N-acetyltransferase n=1 Tax=Paracoccus liaowanqingii TaxID=2560053 RepID=A0A4P7HN86_9RHOB|nr:GNAT family N-acetyltransferase [Paracoccus liaowanqingii]QBX34827.1 GNAT family N-acetyltransferase [Paracoccus liaowanqingii]
MPPPVVLTRPWPEDAEAIAAALSNWDTTRWLSTPPWPYGVADAQEFIAQASLDEYAIRLGDRLAGTVLAGRAFGLWIAPDLQGQGIGRRAGVLALSRLFLSGAEGVHSHVLLGNERSERLLDWLGFAPQGRATIRSRPLDRPVAATVLHLDRAAFEARHAIALTTARLSITAITPADMPALHAIVTQPQVARMMLRFRPDMRLDEAASLLADGGLLPPLRLAVRHAGRVIGAVGLSAGTPPRLHYFLDPQMAGQGFGQEMVAAVFHELVARFAPPEIMADVFLDNPASRKILKNLGFRRAEDVALFAHGRDAQADAALYRWRPGLLP